MRIVFRTLACAVLLCLASTVYAQGDAQLEWTPPAQFTNGDPLVPVEALEGYGVYVDGERVATAAPEATAYLVEDLSPGSHEFYVTAIASNGAESDMSNVAVKVIPDNRVPEPPTLLDVLIAFVKDVVRAIFGWFA